MKKIIATVMSAALLTGLISGTTVTNLQAAEVNTAGNQTEVQETTEQTNEIDSFDSDNETNTADLEAGYSDDDNSDQEYVDSEVMDAGSADTQDVDNGVAAFDDLQGMKPVVTGDDTDVQQTETEQAQQEQSDEAVVPEENTQSSVTEEEDDPMALRAQGDVGESFYDANALYGIDTYALNGSTSASMGYDSLNHNSRFNGTIKRVGIDVSSWQGNINWAAVKASGVEYAFVRIGYRGSETGSLAMDSKAVANLKGAANAGLRVGAYIFSQALNDEEARQEANYICDKIAGYKIDLPVVIDYEYRAENEENGGRLYKAHLSQETATSVVNTFGDVVRARGYVPMVYANKSMLQSHLHASQIKYQVWLANYTNSTSYAGSYTFWQYSSSGHVDGISGNVDCDVWYDSNGGEYSVCDGVYTISSKLNTGLNLDIAGASLSNGGNVQLYQGNGSGAQKFKITYVGNGCYTIDNVNSGKRLDIAGGSAQNGANVQQYDKNGSDAQKWFIKSTNDGYYTIISAASSKVLDVKNGRAVNGANIQQYDSNGSDAQRFKLTLIDGSQTVSNGLYHICSAINNDMVLDISGGSISNHANLQLYRYNGSDAQKFMVTYRGNGYYVLTSYKSGKVLDVENRGGHSLANVQQFEQNGDIAQKWLIRSAGNGYYYIVSAITGNYLDVYAGKASNGNNIDTYAPNGSAAQKFKLNPAGGGVIRDANYEIQTATDPNIVVDIKDGSTAAGANARIFYANGTTAQKYAIASTGDGYYIIRNVKSGNVLDVAGASTANGANVQQYSYNGTLAQKWVVRNNGDGTYSFVNAGNGKCLDITSGRIVSGANLQQYTDNGSLAQKFRLKMK